ncbi:MAG: iron chelate uptake ABC transporter family permease subunit [Chitinivibrionales bacterium]|nr:iron chelate uptake ABC transporter family permease subunit [Chitinivibrionales bacterium]
MISAFFCLIAPFLGMDLIGIRELSESTTARHIFFSLRLPRTLTGFWAGGCLALCGMVFQAMFRNPLATPYTLGVSSGASFGASITILTGFTGSFLGVSSVTLGAFTGAVTAMLLVYGFSSLQKTIVPITMLLAGIAVSFFFSSMLLFAQFMSNLRHSFQIIRWLMGGVEVIGYDHFSPALLIINAAGLGIILWKLVELNHLLTGDDIARSRGVDVAKTKLLLFFGASLTVSLVVSICGPIGFVGIMAPHICRMLFGYDHRILGLASFIFGGTFLVVCDTFARTIAAPSEMPVGVVTALLGGPFFLWVLFRAMKKQGAEIW